MNKVTIYAIVGFLVAATIGVIVAVSVSGGSANAGFVSTTAPALTAADWTIGNKNAAVSVIEYGDYECPACGAYEPIWERLIKEYGDRVVFSFRNFPLTQIHTDAQVAAQAAEAAGLQGKFWEMHNLLYQNQGKWTLVPFGIGLTQYFDSQASSLGLDVTKFNKDMSSDAVNQKINADVQSANAAQVDHTPTFFINLKQIPNPGSYDEFKSAIDQALAGGNATSSASSTSSSSTTSTGK